MLNEILPLNPVLQKPTDVCLVLMPYASLERPSIALSILKTALANCGIDSSVIYANIMFAEKIGAHIYDVVNKSQSHGLAGEWTFSPAAFPDFESDSQAFFEHTRHGLECLQPIVQGLGSPLDIQIVLERIRPVALQFIDELALQILKLQPKIIGCSSTFQQHCASLALLRRLKELKPELITVMGGANCEASMGVVTFQECAWVDYVVSGEADIAFPELVNLLLRQGPVNLKNLPAGVMGPPHRNPEHALALEFKPPRAVLKNMADSPAPDYDDYFAFVKYSSVGRFIKPGLLAETSRGCWWGAISHCTFCGLNGESMMQRSKSQTQALEEINGLAARYGITSIEVVDNILDMSYFNELIPNLAAQEVRYDIFYETKSNLDRKRLRQLADAGIRWLQPGIESLDNTVLKLIGKGTTDKTNLQLLKWAQEEGIFILWIFLYDLPGEEDELYAKMAEWLPLISHLQPPSGFSFIQYNRFSPYHINPQKYGINLSADKSYSYVYPWSENSIERFAYFFDDYTIQRPRVSFAHAEDSHRPGINAVKNVLGNWQIEWADRDVSTVKVEKQRANLLYEEVNGLIQIYDSRSCALNNKYTLTDLQGKIFLICDRFQNADSIQHLLKTEYQLEVSCTEIQDILNEFCALRLMLCLHESYFSLPLRYPCREFPLRKNYPGGRLYSKQEARNMELLRFAEASLIASI